MTFLSNLRMGQPKLATLDARDEVSIVLLDIVKEPNAVISNPASAE